MNIMNQAQKEKATKSPIATINSKEASHEQKMFAIAKAHERLKSKT
jgi:hypothetical protein